MSYFVREIAQQIGGLLRGDDVEIQDVAGLDHATRTDISYVESRKHLRELTKCEAGAIFTTTQLVDAILKAGWERPIVIVDEPQAAFIQAMLIFRPLPARSEIGVSPAAVIAKSASIAAGCNIHHNVTIGENVTIGPNCDIGPGVVIADGVTIGENCQLFPNVVIYQNVSLSDRVIVHANAVIGTDGFGYRFAEGAFEKIPHTGSVLIEDDVEIGACATIDRGMIGATVIGRGTKLDNQVMIAHNCRVGQHNAFASQVGLAGSVTTGDFVQMGGQVGVADHVNIGSGTKFGGKSGVIWDIPDGQISHGIPAIPEKDAIRNHFTVQKLPELRAQLKQLAEQVARIDDTLAATDASEDQKSAA